MCVVFFYYSFDVYRICSDISDITVSFLILLICVRSLLSLLVLPEICQFYFLFFSKNYLFVSLIFSIFLFSVSWISTLIIIISSLSLLWAYFTLFFSRFLRYDLGFLRIFLPSNMFSVLKVFLSALFLLLPINF